MNYGFIGTLLKERRRFLNLTLVDVREAYGRSLEEISRIERGEIPPPSDCESLNQICSRLLWGSRAYEIRQMVLKELKLWEAPRSDVEWDLMKIVQRLPDPLLGKVHQLAKELDRCPRKG